ncbi:Protein MOS2 [Hibiscus syriacus]|uniref:Protein MOS2 n=1 Tax=Hibiscus syriacus TaxID=106335 RepID=A0A6A3AZJ0_HIBSY|nr:protein MOS2-like [Hibiscus syriacus]KAE8709876.1 Protein MOS2 [Hibiscus syriacus]
MKLSFSLPSKSKTSQKAAIPNPSAAQEDQNHKEFVTEFDPSKTLADSKPSFVIPPKQNEWRPYKKMKNLDLPLQSDASRDLKFELDSSSINLDSESGISYGLNLRNNSTKGEDDIMEVAPASAAPVETVLLQSFKEDIERLPDDRGFEEFEDMPVEGFGKALLAGYGWVEGRGIGKNAKEDVKVKQYERRTDKEGLGFSSKEFKSKDRIHGSKNVKENLDKEERVKEDGDGFFVGKDVRVIEGREMGSKGTIMEKLGGNWIVLKLKNRADEVKFRISEIADLGSREEENCLRKLKDLKIKEEKLSKHKGSERKSSKRGIESEKRSETVVNVERTRSNGDRGVSWLRSHIRVRIISKSLAGGRLYLKKGQVVDVVGPYMCDISMDESKELIQGVEQELLETALPRRGGPVLVLYGRHKGVYGDLIERGLDREMGVVRDADSRELLNVKLEQIAEYMGDPSYLGY